MTTTITLNDLFDTFSSKFNMNGMYEQTFEVIKNHFESQLKKEADQKIEVMIRNLMNELEDDPSSLPFVEFQKCEVATKFVIDNFCDVMELVAGENKLGNIDNEYLGESPTEYLTWLPFWCTLEAFADIASNELGFLVYVSL